MSLPSPPPSCTPLPPTAPRSTPILLLYQLHLFIRPILSGAILNSVKSLRCKFASVSFLFLCGRSLVINFIPYSTPQQMARTSRLGFRVLRLLLSAYVLLECKNIWTVLDILISSIFCYLILANILTQVNKQIFLFAFDRHGI